MACTIIRVALDEGRAGLFYASSSDLKGLLVAGQTADEAWDGVPGAVAALYQARGEDVVAIEAQGRHWVIVPRDALAAP